MDKKKKVLTEEEVEQEIARLQGSELVKLAKREERIKTARRRKLYGLRAYEKRGKLLQEQGVTMESLKKQARELEK